MALVTNNAPSFGQETTKHSKEDVLKQLQYFFGEPPHPEKLPDYTEKQALTFYLPDAYQGKSVALMETINSLVKKPDTWYTGIMLPFTEVNGALNVEWDEISFDQRILQRVPYEGTSRMITASKRSHRDRMVRRGIALMIESDFYRSAAGRKFFSDQIQSIKYCVQQTCNYEVMYALLSVGGRRDFDYELTMNRAPHRNVLNAIRKEISNFAAVQKEDRGLDLVVAKALESMRRYGARPDSIILPPELMLYVTMVPDEKTIYNLGGPQAIARFEAGPDALRSGSFRGLNVYTADCFEDREEAQPLQLMQRNVQVGEFYVASAPRTYDLAAGILPNYMDLRIYDEKTDSMAVITLREMMKYALPADKPADTADLKRALGYGPFYDCDGDDTPINSMFKYGGTAPFTATQDPLGLGKNLQNEHKAQIEMSITQKVYERYTIIKTKLLFPGEGTELKKNGKDGGDITTAAELQAAIVTVLGTDKFNYSYNAFEFLVRLVEIGVWVPLKIVIARPFMEHVMLSAILTKAGTDTGASLFGHADMQIAADVNVKTITGHYTLHTKAIVAKEENVYIAKDIMSVGYVAGADTRFFGERNISGVPLTTVTVAAKDVKRQIINRLRFEQEYADAYQSMLAFLTPFDHSQQFMQDSVFSLVGNSGLPWDIGSGRTMGNGAAGSDNPTLDINFPGGKNMFDRYDKLLKLSSIHQGEDQSLRATQQFIRQGPYNNSVCIVGPHRIVNTLPNQKEYFTLVPGQGHWGPDALPGDARWRRGESTTCKEARGAMGASEIVSHMNKVVTLG